MESIDLMRIVEAGIQAPSGENCQPWRFKIFENYIDLFNDPLSDQSLYNVNQGGSLVAHGTCLENMAIASESLGLICDIALFPSPQDKNYVARLNFKKGVATTHPLYASIPRRITNRKKYQTTPLSPSEKESLTNLVSSTDSQKNQVKFLEQSEAKEKLAEALSANERIVFENKNVHNFFFSHVRWTEKENNDVPNGFFVETLELDAKQRKGFGLFRNWRLLTIFNKLMGVSKMVARDNAKVYKASAAIGAIIGKDNSPVSLVTAGRTFERLWLEATRLGLQLQPITGLLFLSENLEMKDEQVFPDNQRRLMVDSRSAVYREFGLERGKILITFRIGTGEAASAHAARFPLEHFIISE